MKVLVNSPGEFLLRIGHVNEFSSPNYRLANNDEHRPVMPVGHTKQKSTMGWRRKIANSQV